MLSEFISLKRILINIHTASIEEAVLICGELLVKDGCASPEYPAAMVETVRQLGDSIVMAPQTALPHAAFSKGGLVPAVSVLRLAQPLDLGGANGPVALLLGFCGSDAESHGVPSWQVWSNIYCSNPVPVQLFHFSRDFVLCKK